MDKIHFKTTGVVTGPPNKLQFDFRTIKRTPDPKCPSCGIAQRFGTVIYCRCMKIPVRITQPK